MKKVLFATVDTTDVLRRCCRGHGSAPTLAGPAYGGEAFDLLHGHQIKRLHGPVVVNPAARLCSEAKDGQILIDSRVRAAVESFATMDPIGELALKGFNRPVKAFNLMSV